MDRYLQQFLVVAELKSISKAAEYLHLSQPTVSANLQRLEARFGVKLYQRQSRGIRLTVMGKTVLKHCREMQQSQQRLQIELADLQKREQGQVRLGCGDAWWELFVRDALFDYVGEQPSALTLSLGNHLDLMAQLLAGKLDGFVGHQIPGLSSRHPVDFTPLFYSTDAVFVSRQHPLLDQADKQQPLSWADLEQYPLLAVTPDNDSLLDLLDDPLPKQRVSEHRHRSAQPLFEVSTLSASLDLLKRSQAIMPYPRAMAQVFAGHGIMPLPVDLEEPEGLIGLYQHRDLESGQTRELIALLIHAAQQFSHQQPDVSPLDR